MTAAVVLQPLTPAQAALIAGMHRVCFAEPWDEAAMTALLAMPGAHGWLAAATQPQGLVLARRAADEVEILTLLVLPPFRRSGLARRLLRTVTDQARQCAAARVLLEVAANNAAAISLYTSMSFVQVGHRPRYYRSGGDALLLALAL